MSKTKIALLWLRYIVINVVFAAAIYFGMFAELHGGTNINGAENLALFMAWLTGILGTVILIGLAAEKANKSTNYSEVLARSDPSVVPFEVDLVFDICVTLAFVWTGHIVLVFFYILSIYAGKQVRDIPKNMVLNKLMSQQS